MKPQKNFFCGLQNPLSSETKKKGKRNSLSQKYKMVTGCFELTTSRLERRALPIKLFCNF